MAEQMRYMTQTFIITGTTGSDHTYDENNLSKDMIAEGMMMMYVDVQSGYSFRF